MKKKNTKMEKDLYEKENYYILSVYHTNGMTNFGTNLGPL